MIQKINKRILFYCAAYFILCYAMAIHWYLSGYFDVINILFDADPNTNLASFAHGWRRNTIIHAFLELFTIPIRGIEVVFSYFGLISDRLFFREILALAISPLFSALSVVYFYGILKQLDITSFEINIFTLIFALSFSKLLFAFTPETYAISGFLMTFLIYYFLTCKNNNKKGHPFIWLCIAIALTGITITNIAIFFIVFYLHLLQTVKLNYLYAFRNASTYSILSIVTVVVFFVATRALLNLETGNDGSVDWFTKFIADSFEEVTHNTVNLFSASLNSFVAAYPVTLPNLHCKEIACNMLSFTRYKEDYLLLLIVAVFFLIAYFNIAKYVKKHGWHEVYAVSLLIILFNFALHSFFGNNEVFIYTQHWFVPLSLLLIPMLAGKRLLSISFLILIIGINFNFILNIDQLIYMHG